METTSQKQLTENRINQIFKSDVLNTREMLLIKGGDVNDTENNSGGSDDQEDGFN